MSQITSDPMPAGTPNLEDEMVTQIATVCHEANRAYCQTIGDFSQKPWDDAPDWQQASARMGVRFHRDNPNAGDSASHDSWMAQKVNDGWVCGPVKDEAKKEHPCMVPFEELPLNQQKKDALFRAIVHALLTDIPKAI
jgi:hypothetical protein